MMEPLISLQILEPDRVYQPHDRLECEFQIDAVGEGDVQALETSVLWYTEGKGDEDLGVHFFERHVASEMEAGDLRELQRFHTDLPNSPLSYPGAIVKIRWCARVRVFLRRGKEAFFDQPFQLGDIPAARAILPASDDESEEEVGAAANGSDKSERAEHEVRQ